MNKKKTEQGQALILIVFALIGLLGMTALTVDGGMAYSNRRHAQNAADMAAWAAGLAYARGQDIYAAGYSVATENDFDNNGASNTVTVSKVDLPDGTCPNEVPGVDITVEITSVVDTFFGPVIGIPRVTNLTTATTRTCGTRVAPLFDGNAIVGLSPDRTDCAFDSNTGNTEWKIEGSGIFSNGCAVGQSNPHHGYNVTLMTTDTCVTTVGSASGLPCAKQNQVAQSYDYPDDILAMMPENPCDGTPGDVGIAAPAPPRSGSVTFNDGVYCISNLDPYDSLDIILHNATLYITDMVFNLKFAGGGGFSGTPTFTGDFAAYYLIVAMNPTPCPSFTSQSTQVIRYRGNGLGDLYGTWLAPSACIDFRGNSLQSAVHSQIIGYRVSANGAAQNYIKYTEEENRRQAMPITIELLK